jgi:putative aldouronate transport system substrate-binding protein
MGFTFDNSDVSAEYTALTNVYNEFHKQLELGFVDPEVGIPQFVERLKNAGLDHYISVKQEQVNEWAAANGIQ